MKKKIPTYRIRLVRDGSVELQTFLSYRDAVKQMEDFRKSDREQFVAFYLNARNQIVAHSVISMGTTDSCLVHPREVFKVAILKNACSILVAHNHPSGDTDPSQGDLNLTDRLREAGKIMGIKLLDHIIVAPDGNAKSIL
jgi:DNA repair protein RadC